jgi:hypothetical protein
MRRKIKTLTFLFSFLLLTFFSMAQERFELGVSAKAGYYFPQVVQDPGAATPENALSPGLGVYLHYFVSPKISIGTGGRFNYLRTNAVLNSEMNPRFNWHSLDVPLQVNYMPFKQVILSGGITAMTQVSDVYRDYKNPEWSWQAGAGWEFDKFRLLLHWSQGFDTRYKYLPYPVANSYTRSKLRYREIYLSLEVPLWRF